MMIAEYHRDQREFKYIVYTLDYLNYKVEVYIK